MKDRLKFALKQREKYPYISADNLRSKHSIIDDFGFGYEWDGKKWIHIPHTGSISIGANVTIHAGANIVKGTGNNDITTIGNGTKIDFGVHVAHNVKIGKHCLIVAGAVIGGSAIIGDNVYIGMGALIKNKIKIGNGAIIGMGAVVLRDVPDGETWVGNPANKLR